MNLSPIEIYYLFLMLIGVPYLAFKTAARVRSGIPLPTRWAFVRNQLLMQILTLALALWTARNSRMNLFPPVFPSPLAWLTGAMLVVVGAATIPSRWKKTPEERRRVLKQLVPRHGEAYFSWTLICFAAGTVEEIAWRGVLFNVLSRATGSWWAAALLSAAAFGLAHRIQGWIGVIAIGTIALAFQGLVLLAGSLYVAMAAHFAYDLLAGFLYAKQMKDDLPTESLQTNPA